MLKIMKNSRNLFLQQCGVAAVEFAIIAMLLFTLLFGIIEFGRMFYVFNTVQEVTRRAAREAVIRWIDTASQNEAKNLALFGGASLPAGAEITSANITIEYLKANGGEVTKPPNDAEENILACLYPSESVDCIALVQVSISGATYVPMVGLFPFLAIPIPASTVTMPAESMGYSG
jgi:Flp pilus assembly protein TadG